MLKVKYYDGDVRVYDSAEAAVCGSMIKSKVPFDGTYEYCNNYAKRIRQTYKNKFYFKGTKGNYETIMRAMETFGLMKMVEEVSGYEVATLKIEYEEFSELLTINGKYYKDVKLLMFENDEIVECEIEEVDGTYKLKLNGELLAIADKTNKLFVEAMM